MPRTAHAARDTAIATDPTARTANIARVHDTTPRTAQRTAVHAADTPNRANDTLPGVTAHARAPRDDTDPTLAQAAPGRPCARLNALGTA